VSQHFEHFAAIDWSGAVGARQKGIALALCHAGHAAPQLVAPPAGGWSRLAIMHWLLAHAAAQTPMLVGMDLSPALPFADAGAYFPGYAHSPPHARALWAMVDAHCAHEPHLAASSFATHSEFSPHFRQQIGRQLHTGTAFPAGLGRLRHTEHRQRLAGLNPVSCFNLVGAAQVGKSSLTAMRMFHQMAGAVPIWPFDPLPSTGPVVVEIYTALAARHAGLPKGRSKIRDGASLDAALAVLASAPHAALSAYDDHSTDAVLSAAWLRHVAGRTGPHTAALWQPAGLDAICTTEGWTFGVA